MQAIWDQIVKSVGGYLPTIGCRGYHGYRMVGIILSIGLYLARLALAAIKGSNMQQKDLIATLCRVAILLLVGSIAIRQMGLANEIINLAFGLIPGAIAVAAAIAFGIGGRDIAARKLQEWSTARGMAALGKQETS